MKKSLFLFVVTAIVGVVPSLSRADIIEMYRTPQVKREDYRNYNIQSRDVYDDFRPQNASKYSYTYQVPRKADVYDDFRPWNIRQTRSEPVKQKENPSR